MALFLTSPWDVILLGMKKTENYEPNKSVALYTKYRPQKFSEVLGQEHVTEVLTDSIKAESLSHAYVFAGTRGTGKTSVARIFAKEIGTSEKDLYEIDAASNNSVEDIRELNDAINLLPFDSKYKVYILDEVHMLSKSAFNALLKTLEEPPAYAIFILATTEPEKIPETVLSRCEIYHFKTPNRALLKKMLESVAKKEGFTLESGVSELISVLADGSFRDAHTILQKMLRTTFDDKKITVEEVEKITGAPKNVLTGNLVEALVMGDLEKGLETIRQAGEENLDPKIWLRLILERYRVALLLKVAKTQKKLYENLVSEDELKFLDELVNREGAQLDSAGLSVMLSVAAEINYSPLPYLPLELALIQIIGKNRG